MTPKEMITVEKEVYEAVLRNSVRVNDLEAENHKLKEINLWHSEKSWDCEKEKQQLKEENAQLHKFLEEFNALEVAKENQQLKALLRECESVIRFENEYENEKLLTKIDNAIGEK